MRKYNALIVISLLTIAVITFITYIINVPAVTVSIVTAHSRDVYCSGTT